METPTVQSSSAILVLQGGECAQCGTKAFPPPVACSKCLSEDIRPYDLSREGTLYASSIIHIAPPPHAVPFGVGYVDLEDDVRVFVHFDASTEFKPGDRVRLSPAEDGVPVAQPLEEGS